MGDTTIRIPEEVKARLDLHRREGESYGDVIRRLIERDRWAGFGVLTDTEGETSEGMDRIRETMCEGLDDG